jgi:3-dehydroquinate dehydratase
MADTSKETVKDSPFVTSEDTFDIAINYYKDNKKTIVEGTDSFDKKKEKSSIVFTMRYPSQADCEAIMQQSRLILDQNKELNIQNIFRIEAIRFLTLIKSWNMDKELNNENVMSLHPDIVRQALVKIREEITTHGLF